MTSGVTVSDACIIKYEEIRNDKKHRYIVFHIADDQQINVEVVGNRDATYDDFLEHIKVGGGDQCRYGVFDYEYEHQPQGTSKVITKEKLFMMLWCPDTANVPSKMLYASSYDALKQALEGVQKYIQANDEEEASVETVEGILRATDRD